MDEVVREREGECEIQFLNILSRPHKRNEMMA